MGCKITPGTLISMTPEELASRIDYALLLPWENPKRLGEAIKETLEMGLRCLILTPTLLSIAYKEKYIHDTCIGAVAGFPYGYSTIEAKIKEVEDLIAMGAREIDYVMNYQLCINGQCNEAINEVKAVTEICRTANVKCKVIVEAPALSRDLLREIVANIAIKAKPDYIKTSTGFGPRKTLPEDVYIIDKVLKENRVRNSIGIKAAGGIRTTLQALHMISLGADIIGTSTPKQILDYEALCEKDS